jgi:hypothetical protein
MRHDRLRDCVGRIGARRDPAITLKRAPGHATAIAVLAVKSRRMRSIRPPSRFRASLANLDGSARRWRSGEAAEAKRRSGEIADECFAFAST